MSSVGPRSDCVCRSGIDEYSFRSLAGAESSDRRSMYRPNLCLLSGSLRDAIQVARYQVGAVVRNNSARVGFRADVTSLPGNCVLFLDFRGAQVSKPLSARSPVTIAICRPDQAIEHLTSDGRGSRPGTGWVLVCLAFLICTAPHDGKSVTGRHRHGFCVL